jgi:hypothetical protein
LATLRASESATSDEFATNDRILENGTPQTIAAFERVSMPARTAAPAVDVAAVPGNDVASNERVSDARVFTLVLDTLHVASPRTRVVRNYARQFIERHVGPADLVAVVSPGGLTTATQDFTSNKADSRSISISPCSVSTIALALGTAGPRGSGSLDGERIGA